MEQHYLPARLTDPHTSHESAEESTDVRSQIAQAITALALEAGNSGITINEATEALPQFKPVSVSPVFKPLVNRSVLVRRVIGRNEKGKDLYETREDPNSHRQVIVHFHHTVAAKKPAASVGVPIDAVTYGS